MDESEKDERAGRPPQEGVRIIGAEEAAAALEKGQAEGRRPDDSPKYGDVPPAPSGPRLVHRFPLPDSVDPTVDMPRPTIAGAFRADGDASAGDSRADGGAISAAHGGDDDSDSGAGPVQLGMDVEDGRRRDWSSDADNPDHFYAPPEPLPDLSLPKEGLNVSTDSSPDLPHWTEPPTGEVPRVLGGGDDDEAWTGAASRGPRWRDSHDNWDDQLDMAALADDEVRVGALDESRSERSDIYDFDEPVPSGRTAAVAADQADPEPDLRPDAEADVAAVRTRARVRQRAPKPDGVDVPASDGPDLPIRILTGVLVAVVALFAFSRGTGGTAVLATVIVTACAFEVFTVLRRAGYLPAIPIGLLATVSIMGGAYWKGERAIPLVFALTLITTMLWYLFGVVRARPTINTMVTMGAFTWVGGLGAFAPLMLVALPQHHGLGLLIGAVVVTVACDIGSFVAGRAIGRTPLMPEISPNKTWEGAIGGLTGAIVGALIVSQIHPWSNVRHALLLGLVVAVVSPLGDLCESMIKRDLSLKDMGAILPGHGGVLDRFDSLLFVLPAAYYLALYLNIR